MSRTNIALTIVAFVAIWLLSGGLYTTRSASPNGMMIYRVNKITGGVSMCGPRWGAETNTKTIVCVGE